MALQRVSNEAGDELEVEVAIPSEPYGEVFNKECIPIIPYREGRYNPCGYVTFYDAKWETSEKAPDTNIEEDAEYDGCGKLVSTGKTEGWHITGKNYTTPGWHAGYIQRIPYITPDICLGVWTLKWTYTQTFSDGETLSATVEVPFPVSDEPIPWDAFWGGGNPAELCSQACHGDPVNTASGDFYETTSDLAIPGRGPGLEMARSYSSLAARFGQPSPMGRGWSHSYDMSLYFGPQPGLVMVTNPNGSKTRFEKVTGGGYAAPPRVLATLVAKEGGGYVYTVRNRDVYTFDKSGKLVGIADLNGEETTLSYDEEGRLESATDPAGRHLDFSYDANGWVDEVSDSAGRAVEFVHDEAGDLEKVTDTRGGITEFTYDEKGLLLSKKDARGNVALTNSYNESGQVKTQEDATEGQTTFEYFRPSPDITIRKIANPRGNVTEYEYENDSLVRRSEGVGTSYKRTWTYELNSINAVIAATDPNGHTTHAEYDAGGNLTFAEDPLERTIESSYDSFGNVTKHTDAEGVTTTYTYDEVGNLLSVSTPLSGSEPPEARVTTYVREDEAHPGDITAITDPDGRTTEFGYDAAGNPTSIADELGNEATFTYDALGRPLTEVSPRGNGEGAEAANFTTTFEHDPAGNLLMEEDPLGHERSWTYDGNGNVESETDLHGHTTTFAYDGNNRLVETSLPSGESEVIGYDPNGNVESQTNALEQTTAYSYDPLDQLASVTDPLERETHYRYDQAGNPDFVIDPTETATVYQYDDANQLKEIEYEDGETANVEFGYDENGRRASMKDGTGETTYEYDSLGRLVTTTNGHGDTTTYDYDLAGNATSITYPNEKTVTRVFDEVGRLAKVKDWLGNATAFSYDPDSNLLGTAFSEESGNADEYEYDAAGRLSGIKFLKGAEELASLGYSRDSSGYVSSVETIGLPGAGSQSVEYDKDDRLTQAGTEAFGYDAAGNLTQAPGTSNRYDAAGQLRAGTGVAYEYDRAGRRTAVKAPTAVYQESFGSSGSESGQLDHPAGIAVDSEGDLWVVDQENDRVEEFDAGGEYLRSVGSSGPEAGQFERPADVAIDSEDNLWVADAGGNRVVEFDAEGEFVQQFGSEGAGNGEFAEPESLAIDSGGNIWVADTYNGRIQEFDQEGEFLRVVGEYGSEEGQLLEAVSIAIGPEDSIWVADYSGSRVTVFDDEGELVRHLGEFGSGPGQFEAPDAVDVDVEGNVWVGDETGNRIQKFNQSGEFLGQFGEAGSGEGEFAFAWPMGMATDGQGNIWIADAENDRLQRWEASTAAFPATDYEYDQAGSLTEVQRPSTGETPAVDESFSYDGDGLRASRTASGKTRHEVWDSTAGLPLLLDDGDTSYIYGPGGLPIEHIDSEEAASFYHHDQLGSTRMLTDETGAVTGAFTYGAYGSPVASSGTQTTPLGYAGQYTNAQSGLQYLRARTYDPVTGQFLTRDPLVSVTAEPYAYTGGNPLNFTDPSGLLGLPSLRDLATAYVGFWDGATFSLTSKARDALGVGEGGLELCGPLYEWAQIAGTAASSILLAELAPLRFGRVVELTFGHGARHLAGTGLAQAEVEAAITSQVARQVARGAGSGQLGGTVVVNGQTVVYRAYVLPDGSVNVGTYFVPR